MRILLHFGMEAQHKVCSCELDTILASKRKTIKQDLCCWVVCAIPSQAGGNCSPLFIIFFKTFIGFYSERQQYLL